ncbi:restriction endonuclease [Candidatus Bathyarchaeota archaeon]|nr:restriction endonuclease [Candidatus Bathyarchaeota archaeon]
MAIPTFDQMLRPVLALASKENLTRRSATDEMVRHFSLTDEEQRTLTPSGTDTVVHNRTGWAMTYLVKAELIEKIAPRTYHATQEGVRFAKDHPSGISVADLEPLGQFQAFKSRKPPGSVGNDDDTDDSPKEPETQTPIERLDDAIALLDADVRSRLLDAVLKQSSTFFEQLVLDVLVAMGYGGTRIDAAQRLGKSGDEGIDGRINQDPLGLDQIMVQAKKYAPDRPIDRSVIQAFIGSLAGQGVTKGIFITTSSFAESAKEFVLRGSNTKVVLIDGSALLDFMLRHHIGVRVEREVEVLDLDQNYFSDEE